MPIAAGTCLGRYEIQHLLGAGGMGEVYRAMDTELSRPVALKVLPPDVASDQQRMQRFIQEARAASGLNHPNILTIYEIGRADASRFIVAEFIDGETLRQHLARGAQMKLHEALEVAVQVASALSAAHAAGIVHRDIKPENIMLRRDGYVKVLDFGLAKLTERPVTIDTEAPTYALLNTAPGMVMGTTSYMSPEQARGLEVDARTDIWSLGVALYEMVSGHAPFEGATTSDVIASILDREPLPLIRFAREVPAELERIVTKALAKEREERYQTIKDLFIDLRRLKQRLEVEAEIERSFVPESSGETKTATSGTPSAVPTARGKAVSTGHVAPLSTVSGVEYLVSGIKQHKKGSALALAGIIITLAGLSYGFNRLFGHGERPAPFQKTNMTRLTNSGHATSAAISPDGKYVAYVVDEGGKQSLWVRQVATPSNMPIVQSAEVRYRGAIFSHDANYVYYVMFEVNNPRGNAFQIPVLGGTPKKIIENVDSSITLSPDSKRFAFIRNYPGQAETSLFIANTDGTGEQKIATHKGANRFDWGNVTGPAWSPDGKIIACPTGGLDAGVEYHTVIEVQVQGGAEKAFASQRWPSVGQVAWLPNGSGLVVVAGDQARGESQLWYVSYPEGKAEKITRDLNFYRGVSLTADATALVTVQSDLQSNIAVAPSGDLTSLRQITSGKFNGNRGISWTPDGRIIYTSFSGNTDLWSIGADGNDQNQITSDARANDLPLVSHDGLYIVFSSNRTGAQHIWRVNIDGSNPKQLTNGNGEDQPACSPDGRWVVYEQLDASGSASPGTLWKVSIDGGAPVQLSDKFSYTPVISPDGKLIACRYREPAAGSPYKLGLFLFEDGRLVKDFDITRTALLFSMRWSPDGRNLIYIDTRAGVSNLWSQPIDGGPAKQLTDFKTDRIFSFDWSRDGKQLVLSRGTQTSDVVLVSDFR